MIPSADSLRRAGEILQQIEKLQAELVGLFNGAAAPATAPKRRGRPPGSGKRRNMSPEARAKIAAAQRERWAKYHANKK